MEEVWQVAAAVLASLGGGGLVVFGLSNFLGKVWADRLMVRERAIYDEQLAALRAKLERDNSEQLEQMRAGLGLAKDKHLRGFSDRLATYRSVIDLSAEVVADFDTAHALRAPIPSERLAHFNQQRIRVYGYLAMVAPQSVMDAHDQLMDYLMAILDGEQYDWAKIRSLALSLLNEMRKDVGLDPSPIAYRGER